MEVMKGLEAEITRSGSSSSSCDAYTSGNHETFCPSFFDSKTTVMASIDMAGLAFQMPSSSETEESGSQIPAAIEPSCSSSIEDAEDSSWWLGMKSLGNFSLMTDLPQKRNKELPFCIPFFSSFFF
ncbi:hypothetical protein AMTRI_Chr01g111850 [Amborella trichopoda]|uniref:Uncharacterized protein n=1 Tax=Amborella trichopoda TaxID=13333 RepID=U5D4E7_AMBTC|nr:hypothetical protein AMTR_s00068p00162650 [Amborella trichopoda]